MTIQTPLLITKYDFQSRKRVQRKTAIGGYVKEKMWRAEYDKSYGK